MIAFELLDGYTKAKRMTGRQTMMRMMMMMTLFSLGWIVGLLGL